MMTLHPTIWFKRVNPDAQIPTKAHPSDAAYDLCAMEDVTLRPGEWKMVGSGIACAIPEGFCGMVYPRSGMGCKGLVLKNTIGIIDSHYRGEIKLTLFNNNPTHVWYDGPSDSDRELLRSMFGVYGIFLGNKANDEAPCLIENSEGIIHVHKGDRVAQMRIEIVPDTTLVEVDELDVTDRNESGFGSSGVRGERL